MSLILRRKWFRGLGTNNTVRVDLQSCDSKKGSESTNVHTRLVAMPGRTDPLIIEVILSCVSAFFHLVINTLIT